MGWTRCVAGAAVVLALEAAAAPDVRADAATDDLTATVEAVAQARAAEMGPGGLVVGVVAGARSVVLGFGDTGSGGRAPDGRTVFQIASLTKPFTGTILAEMMRRGTLTADDPLRRHLPHPARVPEYRGRPIRLIDLATHTAGLPNVPETPGFSWSRLEDPRNPYKPLSREEVGMWLAGHALGRPPGTRFSYSNVGMAVLGEALAAAAGTSYEELLRRTVTARFGLSDTTLRLTDGQRTRKAVGHARGGPVPDWEAPAMLPSFGLYSTADDMVRWLRVNLGEGPAEAAGTIALAQQVRVEGHALAEPGILGRAGGMALGWFVARGRDGRPIHWHSGSTGGFNAYMAFSRDHHWGVVALTSSDPERVTADKVATDLVRHFDGSLVAAR